MRTVGTVMAVLGVLLIVGSINNLFTVYDLRSMHDISVFFGGLGVSVALLVFGLYLRGKKALEKKEAKVQE